MTSRSIATTKLSMPISTRPIVPRHSLFERLDSPDWRVGVVAAPAGFGKTSLLSAWAAGHPGRPAWLSCDAADTDPTRFWSGLAATLGSRWPGVGDDAVVSLRRTGRADLGAILSLTNDIAELDEPVALIVDDLHLARPGTDAMTTFLGSLPAQARPVFLTRSSPPFPLSRLRLSGQLLELHADDLRLSPLESREILANNGLLAAWSDVERLHALTEGWPAAIQLAAMSLQRADDPAGFLEAFATTDRATGDFLVDEVLSQLPDEWVEFLTVTSVFDQFDIDLCERLTGRADAGEILMQLASAGLFVVTLDRTEGWFRYHHLLSAFLRARLRAQSPARDRELHERASTLLEERGLVDEAMRHAFAYHDTDRAASIVHGYVKDVGAIPDGELTAATTSLWLHEVGEEMVTIDPRMVAEMALAWIVATGADEGARWLARVEAAHPDPPPVLAAYLHGAWAECLLIRGEVERAAERLERAVAPFDGDVPNDGLLPTLRVLSARIRLALGDVDGARAVLDAAMSRALGSAVLDQVRVPAMRAWVAHLDGDLTRALDLATSALARADELGSRPSEVGRLHAWMTIAAVRAERMMGPVAAAFAWARASQDQMARPWLRHFLAMEEAAQARLDGDADAASGFLTEARVVLADPSPIVISSLEIEAARQALRFRSADLEARVARLADDSRTALLRVEVALHRDDRRDAADLLTKLDPPVTTRERIHRATLSALAAHDVASAIDELEPVLDLAAAEGFARTILSAGTRIHAILSAVPATGSREAYIDHLLERSAAIVEPSRRVVPEDLVEPLTGRELVVLRYLSSRLTNQAIADALYVSVNTLKSHVKSIYRKLAVASRAEAVSAARARNLL